MVEAPPLWQHQIDVIERAKQHNDFALLLDLGVGKTRTALEILRYRCNQNKRILRTLIVGPTAVTQNWANEISKFTNIPKSKVFPLQGTLLKRAGVYEKAPKDSIFVINFEAMAYPKFAEVILNNPPEFLIVDESHRNKDMSAKRTKNMVKLTHIMEKLPIHHRLILTGSPVLNSPMDLFSQYLILDAGRTLGTNFFAFRGKYFEDKNRWMPKMKHFPNFQVKNGALDLLKAAIAPISAEIKKSECLTLPPLVYQEIEVGMSTEQKKAYDDMKKDFIAFVGSGIATAQLAITKMMRLQQILSGFIKKEDGEIHTFKENLRADALSDILQDAVLSQKVVIWGVFQHDHQVMASVCDKLKIKYRTLTGATEDKQKNINDFQNDPEVRVIIASQAAGGTGVNLTAASLMIYYSRSFSLEHNLQSEARCYRGGSDIHSKITRIDLFAKGTADQLILEALRNKKNLADEILDLSDLI